MFLSDRSEKKYISSKLHKTTKKQDNFQLLCIFFTPSGEYEYSKSLTNPIKRMKCKLGLSFMINISLSRKLKFPIKSAD